MGPQAGREGGRREGVRVNVSNPGMLRREKGVHNGENSAHQGAITVGLSSVDIPVSALLFPSPHCYSRSRIFPVTPCF